MKYVPSLYSLEMKKSVLGEIVRELDSGDLKIEDIDSWIWDRLKNILQVTDKPTRKDWSIDA